MTFNIRDHIEFNPKGRAQCPCCLLDGKTSLNLSVQESGAYKCFRGCSSDDIRKALGQERPKQIAPPPLAKRTSVTAKQVDQAHQALLRSRNALPWLLARGIRQQAIEHYRLGAVRTGSKSKGHKPCISIPIPLEDGRYGIKKRVQPWEKHDGAPWMQTGLSATVYSTHSPESPREIWLCEGEWDAISLGWRVRNSELKNDIHVACFTCGAGNIPPASEIDRLPQVPIVTFYDLDEPGQKGAAKLQNRFKERVSIATVPAPSDAPAGYDISDALNNGATLDEIRIAAQQAKPWVEPKRENPLRERLVTNDELMARAADYTDWLVPDLITQNEFQLLAGPPRIGKGFFSLGLAIAVASGGKFLDRPCTQGTVIYVNLEDSESKIKQRQLQMEAPEGLSIIWLDKFKLSELDYLIEIADEIDDLRLIILDTLSRIRDDGQEESSSKLSQILEPLQEFPKERNVAVLAVHHLNKLGEAINKADPFDLIRGHSSIRGTARGAMMLMPGEDCHRLVCENGHTDKMDLKIRKHSRTLNWTLMGNWAPPVNADMRTQIEDYLNREGHGTVTQIAKHLGFNARSVGTILSRLHADEFVSKIAGRGRSAAIYTRSFNSLQHAKGGVEACDVDRERNTSLLQRSQEGAPSAEKVINDEKSDQCIDHFSEKRGGVPGALKQSGYSDRASDTCFNEGSTALKQTNPTTTEIGEENSYIPPQPGDKVRYCGNNWQKQRALGKRHLIVDSAQQNDEGWWVTVSHKDVALPQTVRASDVKLVQS